MKRWFRMSLILLLAVVAASVGAEPKVGMTAPAFSLPQPNGKQLSLKDLKGKVVILNFWDFGCPSCNLEVRHLEQLHRKYGARGLRVVGIAELEPNPDKVRQFLEQYRATYAVVMDPQQRVGKKYGVVAHPTTLILDRAGVIRFTHTGFLKGDEKVLEEAVRAILEGRKLARR
jgi:peroxiredoxin